MNPPASAPRRSVDRTAAVAFGLVFLAALRAAWSTLDRGFLGDDFAYIARFHALPLADWPALFARDWSGGLWGLPLPELRPFAALTFWIDARLWGANPLGYHLTNLALDTAAAWLVTLVVWRLHGAPLWAGAAAGILFAWHPVHAEPVAWITGRVDLLATAAYLAAFFGSARYLQGGPRRWLAVAAGAALVGCFSKEFCLTLPIAVLLWALVFRPRAWRSRGWSVAAVLIGAAALFLLCRRLAFGPGAGTVQPLGLLSVAHAERQFDYLRWYWPPFYFAGRTYRPQLVGLAPEFVFGGAAVAFAALLLWRWRNPAPAAWRAATFYGAGWYAIATLPMAAASYFSPRHLYLATAGLAIGAGLLLARADSRRTLAWIGTAALAWFCLVRFDDAVGSWRRSAKISEAVGATLATLAQRLPANEAIVLDVPAVHEGVWLWAYAAPFAWQPPFQTVAPAGPVLTAPTVYHAPHRWAGQPALAELSQAPRGHLVSLDAKGRVQVRVIPGARLAEAAPRLQARAAADPDAAWTAFLRHLTAP